MTIIATTRLPSMLNWDVQGEYSTRKTEKTASRGQRLTEVFNGSIWILVDTRGVPGGSEPSPAGTRRSSVVTPKCEIQEPTTTVFRVASQKVKQVVFGRSTVRLKVR